MPQDSTKVAVSDIRIANQLFVERDFYEQTSKEYERINAIQANVINTQTVVIDNLTSKIDNLEVIIQGNQSIYENELNVANAKVKKIKQERNIVGLGSAILLIIAIII